MQHITPRDIAKNEGRDIATIRGRWNKYFAKGTFDQHRELSPEEVAVLSRNTDKQSDKRAAKKPAIKKTLPLLPPSTEAKQPAAATPPARFRMPSFGISEFLAVAIYGHTILVWYEVAVIFGVPGILAGVVVFALKHAAVVICRDGRFQDYVTDVRGVALLLDILAIWAHYTAFLDAMPERFASADANIAAGVLGVVVSSGAFFSLYFMEKTA